MPSVFLYCFGVAAVAGILFAESVSLTLLLVITVSIFVYGYQFGSDKRLVYMAVLGLCVFGLFAWRTQATQIVVPDVSKETEFLGVVVEEPDIRDTHAKVVVQTENTKLIVTTAHYPKLSYGDEVLLTGEAVLPKAFETETGRVFKYDKYLHMRGITHQLFYPELEYIGERKGNVLKQFLFDIKHTLLTHVSETLKEPHSALVGGVVFGVKESLGEKILEDFRRTGLIHIVVLSGYNVTIIAEALMRSLVFLSLQLRVVIGSIAIIFFAIMTGAGATIVRASIMAILVIIARVTGRVSDMNRLLVLAGLMMLFVNPQILLFDASFQLSFIATWGLLNMSPHLEKYFLWITERFGLREIATATIATQIAVLPLLTYMVGEVSLIAPIVNLLVLPIIPAMMLFGFLTGLIGIVSGGLATIPGIVTYMTTGYTFGIVEFFSSLFFATVSL